jgi:hypothetical protein
MIVPQISKKIMNIDNFDSASKAETQTEVIISTQNVYCPTEHFEE